MSTLLTGKVMRSKASLIFGILLGVALVSAVMAIVFTFAVLDQDTYGLRLTLYISAGCCVFFSAWAFRVRSGSDFELTVVRKPDNSLAITVMDPHERKTISEPFLFDYFYFKEYVGRGSLHVKKLMVRIIKDNKINLVLEDSYGAIYDPPASWPEWEPGNALPLLPDGTAHKTTSYSVTGFNTRLAEKLVTVLKSVKNKYELE